MRGALFHIMSRGVAGQPLFLSDRDYALFLRMIERVQQELPFLIHCFCLMPNHFHFLIELLDASMSIFMQKLKSAYAAHFNQALDRRGPVFGGRFPALECVDDDYYFALVRYITRNPVKAGLAQSVGDWPWSSHRQIMDPRAGSLVDRERLLSSFDGSREGYERHVCAPTTADDTLFLARAFPCQEDRAVYAPGMERELESLLQDLAARSCAKVGLPVSALRASAQVRRPFIVKAKSWGLSGAEIARFLRCSESTVSRDLQAVRKEGV